VAVVVFDILRLTPGDVAAILAGDAATPEQLAAIRHTNEIQQSAIDEGACYLWDKCLTCRPGAAM